MQLVSSYRKAGREGKEYYRVTQRIIASAVILRIFPGLGGAQNQKQFIQSNLIRLHLFSHGVSLRVELMGK